MIIMMSEMFVMLSFFDSMKYLNTKKNCKQENTYFEIFSLLTNDFMRLVLYANKRRDWQGKVFIL